MRNSIRSKARPLLLAAISAATLVISGCDEHTGGSGNLMAPDCDMYPTGCTYGKDMSVPDLAPSPDLGNPDAGDSDAGDNTDASHD
ncbi:MAG: hypothetical protein ABI321_13325 [Polyangia bacterium]